MVNYYVKQIYVKMLFSTFKINFKGNLNKTLHLSVVLRMTSHLNQVRNALMLR